MLVDGFRSRIVATEGLIAHGRGEAYDYLIGERTTRTARRAIRAAAAMLILSKKPVISVNGNAAALCPNDIVQLGESINAAIEVNLFYRTKEREMAIRAQLEKYGARQVLGVKNKNFARIPELQSERRHVDSDGIYIADTVFVPLEDGDRTEALVKMGKTVITVDLNPLSRTAKKAHITIVDNIVRAMPALVREANSLKESNTISLKKIVRDFDNRDNLRESLKIIKRGI
jgi:4-phosphopantoate--beta-alanine ligase